jgi:hypothetical protein
MLTIISFALKRGTANMATVSATLKRLIVGNPLRTEHAIHERLTKKTALAVFSSDALSSTAYATEEILLVLAVAVAFGQANAFSYVIPISVGIVLLLAIVAISYRQTIHAYPSGGGAYIVAKDNLGVNPGLVAAASLLVDYILTVSVSISAGVAAITSATQGTSFAWLDNHKVALCLFFIALIAIANLRGIKNQDRCSPFRLTHSLSPFVDDRLWLFSLLYTRRNSFRSDRRSRARRRLSCAACDHLSVARRILQRLLRIDRRRSDFKRRARIQAT